MTSMSAIVACLLFSATAVESAPRHPDAVSIFHCHFDQEWDSNFDEWPDNWTRRTGPGYPHPFLRLRAEALGRGERDVLRRAVGLREHAVPESLGRALEPFHFGCGLHGG